MRPESLARLRAQHGGALVTVATRLIDLPCRYGMHLLIALRLPLAEVGAFYIVYGVMTIAGGLGRMGVDRALTREMARVLAVGDVHAARSAMFRAFRLVGAMSLGLTLVALALAWPLATLILRKPDLTALFLVGALTIVPLNLSSVAAGALAGLHKVTLSQIVYTWLWPAIFCLTVLLIPMSAANALLAIAFGMVGATLIGCGMLYAAMPRAVADAPRMTPAPLFGIGASLFSAEFVQLLISAAPTFALGVFAPTAEAGLYAIAWRVVLVIYMFVSSVSSMVSPRFARLYALDDKVGLQREAAKALGFALTLAIIPILVVSIEAVRILQLFGTSYAAADSTLRILLVGQLAVTLTTTTPELLGMTGYARALFRLNLGAFSVLVVGCTVFTPQMGADGAALAVSGTMLFNAIGATLVARRRLGFFPLGALYASLRGRSQAAASASPTASGVH